MLPVPVDMPTLQDGISSLHKRFGHTCWLSVFPADVATLQDSMASMHDG